ncbi:uncharacterized protein LOC125256408 [Megalobrama amblycephala]|uniref:uncharacterized protein LOC125256408 n=1 Tax=Megalobrama amblycephala TaxID=75352 RepID=UPI0020141B40|nr:uncharacterized protein LOC125256408 [Megalobrama amblycephala]
MTFDLCDLCDPCDPWGPPTTFPSPTGHPQSFSHPPPMFDRSITPMTFDMRGVVRTEGEFPSQEIVAEGEDSPPDGQTLLLHGAVLSLSLRELTTNVQHRPLLTLYLLRQDSTQPSVRRVSLQQKWEREIRRVKQRPATQSSLYLGKGLLAQLRPLDRIWCLLFSKISQGAGEVRIIRHKPSIISRQPQELSHLLFGLRARTGRNCCSLINLGTHLSMPQVETQILYFHAPNCTLLRVGRESSPPQRLQDRPQMLHMPLPVITEYDDIIQIGSRICSMGPQNPVHQPLKGSRCPEQPERKCNKLV